MSVTSNELIAKITSKIKRRNILEAKAMSSTRINLLQDNEEKSLEIELASNEAILKLIQDQMTRYVTPENIPSQVKKQAELLRAHTAKIRQQLEHK